MKPTCIAISGSDPTCGAGAQLDIRVMEIFKVRPLSVITGITVQNGKDVFNVSNTPGKNVEMQLKCIAFPQNAAACKIGMLTPNAVSVLEDIFTSSDLLKIPVVLDPILKSSSGFQFLKKEKYYKLFKYCTLVTPNIPEMEEFTGTKLDSYAALKNSLNQFSEKFTCQNVLLKTGHSKEFAGTDFLLMGGNIIEIFEGKHHTIEDIHGTGCFLSTAIGSCIANKMDLEGSIRLAKKTFVEYANKSILPTGGEKRLFSFS